MTQQDESGPCKDRRVLWAWLTQLLLGQVASPRSSPESRELKEAPALWRVVDLSLSLPSLPSQACRCDLNGRERLIWGHFHQGFHLLPHCSQR